MDNVNASLAKRNTAHGHVVHYSHDTHYGYDHLANKLDKSEADPLFFQAKRTRRPIDFEDRHGRNYVLTYDSGGSYHVEPRAH